MAIVYLRVTRRKNADGTTREYLQLAHNQRDDEHGWSRTEIVHSFGRADEVDAMALRRLARSIARHLGDPLLERVAMGESPDVDGIHVSPAATSVMGAALWSSLSIGDAVHQLARGRAAAGEDMPREVLELVLQQLASHPSRDRTAADLRASAFLSEVRDELVETLWFTLPDVLHLRTDVLHVAVDRTPAAVHAVAATEEGVPVQCWTWDGQPRGNEVTATVEEALEDWFIESSTWSWRRGPDQVAGTGPASDDAARAIDRLTAGTAALRPGSPTGPASDGPTAIGGALSRMLAVVLVRAAEQRTSSSWPALLGELNGVRDVAVDLGAVTVNGRAAGPESARAVLTSLEEGGARQL